MFCGWKQATSSLLWIHGKRMYFSLFIIVFLMETRTYSGIRKERAFVRAIPFVLFQATDVSD